MGAVAAMKRTFSIGIFSSLLFAVAGNAADLAAPVVAIDAAPPEQPGSIFNEARFGSLVSIEDEDGAFVTGLVLFDPWGHEQAQGWDKLLRPRLHVGATISTADEANQVYAGFSWTANVTDRFFLELGFGGTLHDGDLDPSDGGDSPKLGCRALFHEYAAAGYNVTESWSIIAQIEHSSHAELCDGPNNGLSRAGILVGYKF
nr:acyloxyacyl hydrolase [Rhizobium sp. Q54]